MITPKQREKTIHSEQQRSQNDVDDVKRRQSCHSSAFAVNFEQTSNFVQKNSNTSNRNLKSPFI